MARNVNKLTARTLAGTMPPGRHNDGEGLYLLVKPEGGRYWLFRYRDRTSGKHRDKGLGPYPAVSLAAARTKARSLRSALLDGTDPIDAGKQAKLEAKLARAKEITFGACAQMLIDAKRAGWRNAKHAAQWVSTIDTYCAQLKPLPVSRVDTDLVIKVLHPIWESKTETATRVRQRIEAVLDWATARKFRSGENPARWKGHLQALLAPPTKLKNVEHRPALAHEDTPKFIEALLKKQGLAPKALILQILTATRPNEAVAARWDEFDFKKKIWTIPKNRMKAGRDHQIPLTEQAVSILKGVGNAGSGYVFPGTTGRHITTASTLKVLQDSHPDKTCHGFRTTFRGWAADTTNHARDVAEAALAHVVKDATEAAYLRTTMLDKRASLMRDWADYCIPCQTGVTNDGN